MPHLRRAAFSQGSANRLVRCALAGVGPANQNMSSVNSVAPGLACATARSRVASSSCRRSTEADLGWAQDKAGNHMGELM